MEKITKSAKIIGIGNEGISNLESIYNVVKENVDNEKININQDVDKEYVRELLDGVDILLLTYSTQDKRAVDIVKAIAFMAGERRVLSIGLNSSDKEHKEELGLNQEFMISQYNTTKIMNIINMMIEAVSDDCAISIDLTDLKELFASEGGVRYNFENFTRENSPSEIADKLLSEMKEAGSDFIEKKGVMLVEMDKSEDAIVLLYDILTCIQEKSASTYDIIFSLYMKENCNNQIKFGLIYN
ncbi:Uncharacterised protein [uncultured Clostridium sp.]|nr:Uncharacterised protein [uncultured Clostridium sp.]